MGSDVDPDGVYPVPDTGKKNAKLISNKNHFKAKVFINTPMFQWKF